MRRHHVVKPFLIKRDCTVSDLLNTTRRKRRFTQTKCVTRENCANNVYVCHYAEWKCLLLHRQHNKKNLRLCGGINNIYALYIKKNVFVFMPTLFLCIKFFFYKAVSAMTISVMSVYHFICPKTVSS